MTETQYRKRLAELLAPTNETVNAAMYGHATPRPLDDPHPIALDQIGLCYRWTLSARHRPVLQPLLQQATKPVVTNAGANIRGRRDKAIANIEAIPSKPLPTNKQSKPGLTCTDGAVAPCPISLQ